MLVALCIFCDISYCICELAQSRTSNFESEVCNQYQLTDDESHAVCFYIILCRSMSA